MALSKDKFHLRTEHSKLLGYWTVELGGLNQVTHLWEYDSYSHRAGVRAKLGGHQQWQEEYFQKILPLLQHQDNMAFRSLLPTLRTTWSKRWTAPSWAVSLALSLDQSRPG